VPGLVPLAALRLLPVLPLDGALEVPVVHADDVADAVVRVLEARAAGAFNLAAGTPMTVDLLAGALSARHVQVARRVVRSTVHALWSCRLVQVEPGWVDLAYAVPLLATDRAEAELGWRPAADAPEVVEELVTGLLSGDSAPTAALRPRTVTDNVHQLLSQGPVHRRARP